MKIIGVNEDYDPNDIVLIEALTYYKLGYLDRFHLSEIDEIY